MKQFITSLLFLALVVSGIQAQIRTPQPSPLCKVEQVVGLATFNLEYSRPSAKDRKVFGDVVPFGQMWRTGANGATLLAFTEDAKINGVNVPKGKYSVFSIPGQNEWTIILHKNVEYRGVPQDWDASGEVLRTSVKPQMLPGHVETLTFAFNNLRDNGCTLDLSWEKTMVSIPVAVEFDETVMKNIDRVMAGPSSGDLYSAANYYYNNGKDLNKAAEWISKANAASPRYWTLTLEAKIYQKLGKYPEALAAAQKGLDMARKDNDGAYIKQLEPIVAECQKMIPATPATKTMDKKKKSS